MCGIIKTQEKFKNDKTNKYKLFMISFFFFFFCFFLFCFFVVFFYFHFNRENVFATDVISILSRIRTKAEFYLTFTSLSGNSANGKLMIFFFLFSPRKCLDISCKMSSGTVRMKCQSTFSGKNNISNFVC